MAKKTGIQGFIDRFQGDKIIWMIVLMLIMISILAISSSTPLLALQMKSDRSAIIGEQIIVAILGLAIILISYFAIRRIGFLSFLSQFGFFFSALMLICLAIRIRLPFLKAVNINGATRALAIFGFQLHVFEFVKVFMVMYLAWACQAYQEKDGFVLLSTFGGKYAKNKNLQVLLYIFLPVFLVVGLVLMGSVSSALFIGLIMMVTVFIGGIKIKDCKYSLIAGVVGSLLLVAVLAVTGSQIFERIPTAVNRVLRATEDPEEQLLKLQRGTIEFQEALDKVKQPISAKVAVSEGGIIGKGPGRSTQRYVVPVMFEDYMFSFIVEEYGILGALLVIILYGSLLARGSILAKNCKSTFTKVAIGGLVIMISGQALMHMMINVDLGPLTGQTLPMISHGNSSFLAFSLAFGIILSISKMVKKKMDKEAAQAEPILPDELRDRMNDLDALENIA